MKTKLFKRTIMTLIAIMLLMAPLTSQAAVANAPRAASAFDYSVSAGKSGGILAFASVMSNCTESYMNLSVVLQQYKDGKWERYNSYSNYVTNTSTCYISQTENAPKGYYYRVAVSFSSSSLNPVGPLYSNSYYW